ncbi:DUF3613 domain-containing protein [Pseudomonas sp. EL_65y_Pfl2_R95]|uniref:DUF3613 domain-containing protein n=1 Tax=Pseudomonas sp. EL_65y_Pfl2_R95 TaxID=3088698 RepID=UPI0030D8D8A0
MKGSQKINLAAGCLLALGVILPVAVQADEPVTSRPLPQLSKTESWLAIQRDGRAASVTLQTATPAERELAYQRWLDSFSHPIPDFYEQETGGKMTTGSGSN